MIFPRSLSTSSHSINADLCIIGSGAAGMVLASQFLGSSKKVCVLESGTEAPAPQPDPLYQFSKEGLPIADNSRVRAFGGTTTVWGGRWKPLDPIDFEPREYISYSGWPIRFSDLLPYYERASLLFNISYPYSSATASSLPFNFQQAHSLESMTVVFQKKEDRDWGKKFSSELNVSKNISVYFDAHLVRLEKSGDRVMRAHGKTRDGGSFSIEATTFVLAQGGIENPRMLLLSEIGNEYDQVGRYYMDHPKGKAGIIEGYDPLDLKLSAFNDVAEEYRFGLRLNDSAQQKHRILNSHVLLEAIPYGSPFARLTKNHLNSSAQRSPIAVVRNYLEQAPRPENCIVLGEKRDQFGNRRAHIIWSMNTEDERMLRDFHELMRADLQSMRVGELMSPLFQGKPFSVTGDASHHMGTTRMGVDPRFSVVDPNCKVHSVNNLFIAGSSVFPTGGSAGPTATIAALSLRLADHLKKIL